MVTNAFCSLGLCLHNGDLADTGGTCESAGRLEPLLAFGPVDWKGTSLAMFLGRGGGDPGTAASDCEFVGGGLVALANLELRRENTGRAFGELVFVAGLFIEG